MNTRRADAGEQDAPDSWLRVPAIMDETASEQTKVSRGGRKSGIGRRIEAIAGE